MSKLVLILSMPFLLAISSCSINRYVPKPSEISNFTYGMYFKGEKRKGNFKNRFYDGEIIAVVDTGMYLLNNDKEQPLVFMRKDEIKKGKIYVALTSEKPESYGAWALINFLPFAHGFYGIITLPITAVSSGAIISNARQGGYRIKYPLEITWDQLRKFARFPQGIPSDVNHQEIKRVLKD